MPATDKGLHGQQTFGQAQSFFSFTKKTGTYILTFSVYVPAKNGLFIKNCP